MDNNNIEAQVKNFNRCNGFIHIIQKGDTLYNLSKKYGIKVSALMYANPYVNIYNLQMGDELCIPKFRPIVIPVPLKRDGEAKVQEEMNSARTMRNNPAWDLSFEANSQTNQPMAIDENEMEQVERCSEFTGNESLNQVLNSMGMTMNDFMDCMKNMHRPD